ncbi:MAG: hypothetical protein M3289_02340 [Actinomycetota bacterium]|nr:hypothetical protein [Actinomycetota bacterium]
MALGMLLFTELPGRVLLGNRASANDVLGNCGLQAYEVPGSSSALAAFLLRKGRLDSRPSRFILWMVAKAHDASELAEKVREVICAEWQGAGGSLESAVVYRRLLEEGVEVPSYQMSAILNAFKVGGLIAASLGPQREEEVRKHGDLLITSVSSDLCTSSS